MSDRTVRLERRDGTAVVILDHPDKLNALAGTMREELRDAVATAARDSSVSSLVVTGAGRAFCAGGGVGTMQRLHAQSDHHGFHHILHTGAECVLALQAFPGLTVAAVNGIAAGAGLALALNCDLRVSDPSARFAASWSGIGLAPDWGASFWLPRLLGYGRALELVAAAGSLSAERALDLGLVTEIAPSGAALDRSLEVAATRGSNAETIRQTKQLLHKGLTGSLEASLAAETEAQETLFAGDDVAAGLAAFAARRKGGSEHD